jgi:hypothetical protein
MLVSFRRNNLAPEKLHQPNEEEFKMRPIAFVLAMSVVSSPALAQSWEEYNYPEYAISVTFPAVPQVQNTTYQIAEGRSAPARVYSVRQDKAEFKLTIAELANTGVDEKTVLDQAIKTLAQGAAVKLNVPARIYRAYGRQLTLEGADGSRAMAAVFDINNRLYQIEAKVPRGGSEFELTRFQQSLVFDRELSNRTPEQVKAIRDACPGLAGILNGAGNPVTPAGFDDPRCRTASRQ